MNKGERLLIMVILETQKCMLCYEVTHWKKVDTLLSRHLLTYTWEAVVGSRELHTWEMALVNMGLGRVLSSSYDQSFPWRLWLSFWQLW